jgi:predicted AAA+ superfamily ATPase
MITRIHDLKQIADGIATEKKKKVLILFGARQVGKSTLVKQFTDNLERAGTKYLLKVGDNIAVQTLLNSMNLEELKKYFQGVDWFILDEAQLIKNVGQAFKLLHDNTEIKILATGSSSFDLNQQTGEPLVGRREVVNLFPIALQEMALPENFGIFGNPYAIAQRLEEWLIYGLYPDILTTEDRNKKKTRLEDLANTYILKDIFALDKVKSPKVLLDLLKLLAHQIGSEVSVNELARNIENTSVSSINRYLDILEKAFIIKRVHAFSNNPRREIKEKVKIYFYDVGIRNALITNFNPLSSRSAVEVGGLFENFVFMERVKKMQYDGEVRSYYFWRDYEDREVDIVEAGGATLKAFELKFGDKSRLRPKNKRAFLELYPQAEVLGIDKNNFMDFVI